MKVSQRLDNFVLSRGEQLEPDVDVEDLKHAVLFLHLFALCVDLANSGDHFVPFCPAGSAHRVHQTRTGGFAVFEKPKKYEKTVIVRLFGYLAQNAKFRFSPLDVATVERLRRC